MAEATIKLRTKDKGGKIQVKALITHPMETGLRKNKKTGKAIPSHYITELVVTANDKPVMTAHWSGSVSKNPFLSFSYAGSKSDSVNLTWTDNTGKSDSITKKIGER